jgi:hypothetical protein
MVEVPDLDLPLPPSKARMGTAVKELPEGDPELKIELDMKPLPGAAREAAVAGDLSPEGAPEGEHPAPAVSTPRGEPTVEEVAALAAFGPPPEAIWMAPVYALRVLSRQTELRKLLAAKANDRAVLEAKLEDALVGVGERVMTVVETLSDYAALLHPVRMAEQLYRARDGALAAEMDAFKQQGEQANQKISAAERELAEARQVERRALANLQRATEAMARKKAELGLDGARPMSATGQRATPPASSAAQRIAPPASSMAHRGAPPASVAQRAVPPPSQRLPAAPPSVGQRVAPPPSNARPGFPGPPPSSAQRVPPSSSGQRQAPPLPAKPAPPLLPGRAKGGSGT